MAKLFSRVHRGVQRAKAWMMDYAYLVTLGAVIAVIAASAMYTQRLHARERSVQAAAGAPETEATPALTPRVTPLPTLAPLAVQTPARVAVWPLGGGIVRGHDAQEPVYWVALGCYQPHAGLDIAGEAGESVCCAADGVVSRTALDELWGWRVTVAQTDGSETVYAGLEVCTVEAGQSVTRGQALGTLLAQIPCEAELGSHLHLERWRDGAAQDPEAALPEHHP